MGYNVILVPTLVQAEAWRKAEALSRRGGVFSQAILTFDAWIADLWELHGDGRALVDSTLREALMRRAVDSTARESACDLAGVAPFAARCVRQAAGVAQFQRAIDAARAGASVDGLSQREHVFLSAIARYIDDIHERGFVEPGEAAALLACRSARVFPVRQSVLVAGAGALTWVQRQFFESCEQLDVAVRPSRVAGGISVLDEGVAVRFAFPAGRLAQPGLIADVLCALEGGARAVVTCKDPVNMAEQLEARLAQANADVRVQAVKPFSETDFGRAFLACRRVVAEDLASPVLLSDVARGFFGGFSQAEALDIDKAIRGNRIAAKDDVLASLRESSSLFSQLEKLASGLEEEGLLEAFEKRVHAAAHRGGSWRAEQLAALRRLRSILDAARVADVGMDACVEMLERSSVAVAWQSCGCGVEVLVTTQPIAACLPASSCDVALLADLTSEDYPVEDKDDALSTLFSSLGLSPEESALERSRREFDALLKLPSRCVVLVRPLANADAEGTYPAVMLEELIDAYREDPSDASEVDNPYRLPPVLQVGVIERGEELLFANARACERHAEQPLRAEIPKPLLFDLTPGAVSKVAPGRRDGQGRPLQKICPSPSQIETYLECPYQWFASRRLRLDTIDEGFGPLERGSFAHAAFEEFYRRFREAGHLKVTRGSLEEARGLMREVTHELAQGQYGLEPGSGRLVAASELERREVAALCNRLECYLDFEVELLPSYHPEYLEYEIDADHAIDYAGALLVGKVDRIDVDNAGHAVIIDYKGSVNAEHEIAGKAEGRCGKVQTRIYAQAVKRALGLDVVAALYVSYGRNPSVSGAYDPRVVEAAHLPGVKADKCSCGLLEHAPELLPDDYSLANLTFGAMLDETESIVGRALEAMRQGDIAPRPAYPNVCAYCPVLACPKRSA